MNFIELNAIITHRPWNTGEKVSESMRKDTVMDNRFEEFNSEQKEQFKKLIAMEESDCDLGEMINACFKSDPEVADIFSDILLEKIDQKIEELTASEEEENAIFRKEPDDNTPDDTFKKVIGCIHDSGWTISEIDEEKHTLFTMFKALRTVVPVYITVEPEHKSIYFSVPYSFQCKKSHYIFLADEITHINSGIRFGGFQLNYNSGIVSYNYAYNYIKDHFSKDIFLETMKMNILSGDIFYEGLRKLAEDNIPSERIKQLHENLLEVLEEQI